MANNVTSGGDGYNRDKIGDGRDSGDSENNGIRVAMVVCAGRSWCC